MPIWFAVVLGVVQGLTEFLPISSTAHLRIVPALIGQPDPGAAFSAVIQLGTLGAVLVYFARDLFIEMPKAMVHDRKSPKGRLPFYLVAGTIPIVVLGLSLKNFIVGDARSLYVVASTLISVGVLMYVIDRRARDQRVMDEITLKDALIIGLAQACALIPGVSRSGSTIVAALFLGMRRPDAARFSFLLGIPAIAGAGIFQLGDALADPGAGGWLPIVIGSIASFASGYASIAWLLRYLQRKSLAPFAIYRVGLGILLLSFCISGVLAPLSGQ